jgi:hypothetical protein
MDKPDPFMEISFSVGSVALFSHHVPASTRSQCDFVPSRQSPSFRHPGIFTSNPARRFVSALDSETVERFTGLPYFRLRSPSQTRVLISQMTGC